MLMDQLRLAGTSAFGSRTKREGRVASGLDPTTVHPNPSPDSYEMQTVLSLAKQAARSINKKSADGHLGFIGHEARVLKLSNAITKPGLSQSKLTGVEETPGPLEYEPKVTEQGWETNMAVLHGAETMKMAVFASATKRSDIVLPNAYVPGPGSYDPKYSTQEPDEHNILRLMTGRDSKYTADRLDGTGDDCETGEKVGPGSYDPMLNASGAFDSIAGQASKLTERTSMYKKAKPDSNPLGFTATGPLHQLPWETHHGTASVAEAVPGPGAYDPKVTELGSGLTSDASSKETFNKMIKDGKAGFNVKEKARESETAINRVSAWSEPAQMTEVGAYNPSHGRELIDQSKQTFNPTMKAGKGGFGSNEARVLKLSNAITKPGLSQSKLTGVEETPGPLEYEPKVTEQGWETNMAVLHGAETMKMAVFASATKRSDIVLPNAYVPGPGSYDPKYSTQEPDEHNILRLMTGRDSKYTADRLDGTGDDCETGEKVGPGSYDPMLTTSGEKHEMSNKVAARAELGNDASFMSTSFRTVCE